jgi:hypothetical protein
MKTMKTVRTDDVPIRTEDLSNTSQKAYRYSSLLGRLYIIS